MLLDFVIICNQFSITAFLISHPSTPNRCVFEYISKSTNICLFPLLHFLLCLMCVCVHGKSISKWSWNWNGIDDFNYFHHVNENKIQLWIIWRWKRFEEYFLSSTRFLWVTFSPSIIQYIVNLNTHPLKVQRTKSRRNAQRFDARI